MNAAVSRSATWYGRSSPSTDTRPKSFPRKFHGKDFGSGSCFDSCGYCVGTGPIASGKVAAKPGVMAAVVNDVSANGLGKLLAGR